MSPMAFPVSLSTTLPMLSAPKGCAIDCQQPLFPLASTWLQSVGIINRRGRWSRREEKSEYVLPGFLLCKAAFPIKATGPVRQPSLALPRFWTLGNQPLPLSFQA